MNKQVMPLLLAVLVIAGYVFAGEKQTDDKLGVGYGEKYKQVLETYSEHDLPKKLKDIERAKLVEKIARYRAYSEAFGVTLTDEQAMERLYEEQLLSNYAKEQNIYPTEQEVRNHIQVIMDSYPEAEFPPVEEIMKELELIRGRNFSSSFLGAAMSKSWSASIFWKN